MYMLSANYPGHGAHVASATYFVIRPAQGRDIGRALVVHSLDQARSLGLVDAYVMFRFLSV
jgi:GNAT superfamily N-acetyltransferase